MAKKQSARNVKNKPAAGKKRTAAKPAAKEKSVQKRKTVQTAPEKRPLSPERKRKMIIAAIPFAIAVIIYLLIWTEPGENVVDPWFEAAMLVDSSRKVKDPVLRDEMLRRGGDDLRELVKKYDFHARVHFLMGYYYLTVQKWDSAIVEYKTTIKMDSGATINPVAPDAIKQLCLAVVNKSNIFLKNKRFKKARQALRDGAPYVNRSAELATQFGIIHHNQGAFDSALVYYELAMRINPRHTPARNNAALVYFIKGNGALNAGEYKKAAAAYEKSISLNNKNPNAYNNAGSAYMRLGQPKKAVELYKKVLSLNPSDKNAASALKNYYVSIGDLETARRY